MNNTALGVSLLAGTANVIMQLSFAPVGYGVLESKVDSGNLFRHPVKRTRTTLTYLAVATMGTDAERAAYRHAVNKSHAQVRSTATSPVAYNAFDPELQLWVAACLYKGFEDTQHAFLGVDAAPHYQEAAVFGTMLQVRPDMWPPDRQAFEAYWSTTLQEIRIDQDIRRYLTSLVDLEFLPSWLALIGRRFHRFMTTGFLPDHLRTEMQLPWAPKDQRRFDATLRAIGFVVRRLPGPVRRFPFNACLWDLRRRLRAGRPLT
ncbi:DUF2236 domain-containing protein [Kribbella antibiotica]|uniref:DUF2236 domain-containing protein n=1 Tax=Kribbella antibiotica TaxID=190195 RepID=A0A4R4ZMA4_9ACTN|nr:oxygenase MpaB family protein [Kribbella antibiotica]TDD59971.1 DUF2236 domain-containing protein [Kribbella antibiotica]